jgi:hypothetical protein
MVADVQASRMWEAPTEWAPVIAILKVARRILLTLLDRILTLVEFGCSLELPLPHRPPLPAPRA